MSTSDRRDLISRVADWGAQTPLFRAGIAATATGQRPHRHRVPRIPVMIDEEEADPRSVLEFSGRLLDTVLDQDAIQGRMLHLFSDREKAAEYSDATRVNAGASGRSRPRTASDIVRASQSLTPGVTPGNGYVELYEDASWGGCAWRLLESAGVTYNYDSIWACGFLWWWWKNANDRITCVDSALSADVVIFAEDLNLGGTWLHVNTGRFFVEDLTTFGWNDRISSQTAWYL